jgi:hypothetical protein
MIVLLDNSTKRLTARKSALERANFLVLSCGKADRLAAVFGTKPPDLIVVGEGCPSAQAEWLTLVNRQSVCAPMLLLSSGNVVLRSGAVRKLGAAAPRTFLRKVETALELSRQKK